MSALCISSPFFLLLLALVPDTYHALGALAAAEDCQDALFTQINNPDTWACQELVDAQMKEEIGNFDNFSQETFCNVMNDSGNCLVTYSNVECRDHLLEDMLVLMNTQEDFAPPWIDITQCQYYQDLEALVNA